MCCILIVEDNSLFRSTLKDMLNIEFSELDIKEASSCEEALLKIQELRPSLMIVDIDMPGKNGLELTKMIKNSHSEIEVIVLTGLEFSEYREAAASCGASHFFTKGTATCNEIAAAVVSVLKAESMCKIPEVGIFRQQGSRADENSMRGEIVLGPEEELQDLSSKLLAAEEEENHSGNNLLALRKSSSRCCHPGSTLKERAS